MQVIRTGIARVISSTRLTIRTDFVHVHGTLCVTSCLHSSGFLQKPILADKSKQGQGRRKLQEHYRDPVPFKSQKNDPQTKFAMVDKLKQLQKDKSLFEKELKLLMQLNADALSNHPAPFVEALCRIPSLQHSDVMKDAALLLVPHFSRSDLPTMAIIREFSSRLPEVTAILDERYAKLLPEIEQTSELIHAYKYWSCSDIRSPEVVLLLESKTLRLIDKINANAISIVLYHLSLRTFRNTTLMKTLVDKLYRKPSHLSAHQLTCLLYACATLRLHSPKMFTFLGAVFNSQVDLRSASQFELTNMLISIGKLRWYHVEAVNQVCEGFHMAQTKRQPSVDKFSEMCMTFGTVGHLPECMQPFIPVYIQKASEAANPQYYLDIVWSLLCLGVHTEAILLDVLSQERIAKLVTGKSHINQYNCIKLLNLVTEAKLTYNQSVSRTLLDDVTLLEPSTNDLLAELGAMWPVVLDTEPEMIVPRHFTKSGHLIDFLFLYNTNMGVVEDPSEYRRVEEENSDKEPITSDMKWVAVLVHQFPDKTTSIAPRNKLIGRKILAVQQLQSLGYTLFEIDDSEFRADPNRERRRLALKHALEDALSAAAS